MKPEKTKAPNPPNKATDAGPNGRKIWMKLVKTRIVRPENRRGPRYPNSLPFFEAQKAYAVKEAATPAVNINASSTILP
uniref:Transmembrane BAX inhibitor motif-containing protein 4 n=1 Tax=Arundo donax TaxID=35708 RepID=A0A0A8XS24_ARUDO